jgi:hypothetical protein
MDSRVEQLLKDGDKLFEQRRPLIGHWQDVAEQFYPEEASFGGQIQYGKDFASNLVTSFPLQVRRDLGDAYASTLRPTDTPWFSNRMVRQDREDNQAKKWLEWATGLQKRAMYDPKAQFTKATKKADHFFATFGQAVLSLKWNRDATNLLFRHHHLKDVAFCENDEGMVDTFHVEWCTPTVRDLNRLFRGKIALNLKDYLEKDPYRKVNCRHVVVPAEYYQTGKRWNAPFVSIYVDQENKFLMGEEEPEFDPIYTVPRWICYEGSQYAYSPAVVAALPDARLLQSITLTLLEAGEKAANPPMTAVTQAVRGDIDIGQGGITWVEADYDQRTGDPVRLLVNDKSGIPLGLEMVQDIRAQMREAWFLDRLSLPVMDHEITAYEASVRTKDFIRRILPVVEPAEAEYNAPICDRAFARLQRAGAFGSPEDRPQSLKNGADLQFTFESPFRQAQEEAKGQIFAAGTAIIGAAVQLDPESAAIPDAKKALRDALNGIGWAAEWLRDEDAVDAINQQKAQIARAATMVEGMTAAGGAAKALGEGGIAMREAAA